MQNLHILQSVAGGAVRQALSGRKCQRYTAQACLVHVKLASKRKPGRNGTSRKGTRRGGSAQKWAPTSRGVEKQGRGQAGVGAAGWQVEGWEEAHLCKLEDVFLAVYDFEAPPREPGAHIPRVQPALLVQHLVSLFLVLVVPLEDSGAPHTDLPSRHNGVDRCT